MKEKKESPPEKKYYKVCIEAFAPITLTYKILAENPEEAAILASKKAGNEMVNPPKIFFAKLTKIVAKVYESGTTLLHLTKKF